jgi:hypothetical protein
MTENVGSYLKRQMSEQSIFVNYPLHRTGGEPQLLTRFGVVYRLFTPAVANK